VNDVALTERCTRYCWLNRCYSESVYDGRLQKNSISTVPNVDNGHKFDSLSNFVDVPVSFSVQICLEDNFTNTPLRSETLCNAIKLRVVT
jgi:hypothetical protein